MTLKLLLYIQSAVIVRGLKNGLAKSEEITSEVQWPVAGKVCCPLRMYTCSIRHLSPKLNLSSS